MTTSRTVVFAGIALLCAAEASAQINKCVDAHGRVSYSQLPCPATSKSETLKHEAPATGASVGSSAGTAPAQGIAPAPGRPARPGLQETLDDLATSITPEKRATLCQQLDHDQPLLDQPGRTHMTYPDGTSYPFLAENERIEAAEDVRAMRQRLCQP